MTLFYVIVGIIVWPIVVIGIARFCSPGGADRDGDMPGSDRLQFHKW